MWNGSVYQFVMAGGNPLVVQGAAYGSGTVSSSVTTKTLHQAVHVFETFKGYGKQPAVGLGKVTDSLLLLGSSNKGGVGGSQHTSTSYLVSQAGVGSAVLQARVVAVANNPFGAAGRFSASPSFVTNQVINVRERMTSSFTQSTPAGIGGALTSEVTIYSYVGGGLYPAIGQQSTKGKTTRQVEGTRGIWVWNADVGSGQEAGEGPSDE
jgi:hypothetical protein